MSGRSKKEAPSQAPPQPPSDDGYFAGGFVRSKTPANGEELPRTRANGRSHSRSPPDRSATPGPTSDAEDGNDNTITMPPPPPTQPPVPPNVVRYSLTDKPMPTVVVDDATPPNSATNISSMSVERQASTASTAGETPPETPPIDAAQVPVMANSLAALKKTDTLERRASKRFSTYNISKMTGVRDRLGVGRSINRRSMAVDTSNLTPGELNTLTEEDETPAAAKLTERGPSRSNSRGSSASRRSRAPTPVIEEGVPPIPPLPEPSPDGAPPALPEKGDGRVFTKQTDQADAPPSPVSNTLTVFLQLGREVKKVTIEKGLSFASLRVLFVDKFSYSPGKDNFPEIYIRDPSSGVMYELEDADDVKDRSVLSLNIDRE